jgi:hypothetical protein
MSARTNRRLAQTCSDRFENGRVFLSIDAPWLDDHIVELIGFPGTKHDDQVDSTTHALDHLREPDVVATYLMAFGRVRSIADAQKLTMFLHIPMPQSDTQFLVAYLLEKLRF